MFMLVRCQALLQLKEELETYNIPLLLFSFSATVSVAPPSNGSRASSNQQWCPKTLAVKSLLKNASFASSSVALDNQYIAAVFSDDHQHPVSNQICSMLADQTSLPLFSFDSNSLLSSATQQQCHASSQNNQQHNEFQKQEDFLLSKQRFEEIVMEESAKEMSSWEVVVDPQRQKIIQVQDAYFSHSCLL